MSFQKNPPWQKNVSNVIPTNYQQQMSIQQQFQQNQQHLISSINAFQHQQPNFFNPILYSPNPNQSRINTMAFNQQPQQQTAAQSANQIQQSSNQIQLQSAQQQQPSSTGTSSKYNTNLKTFSGTGIVSKVQNDIGFIDDEVLFHKNVCVKGLSPKVCSLSLSLSAHTFYFNLPHAFYIAWRSCFGGSCIQPKYAIQMECYSCASFISLKHISFQFG